jgi:hypothetical protein
MERWAESLNNPSSSHPHAVKQAFNSSMDPVAEVLGGLTYEHEIQLNRMQQHIKILQKKWLCQRGFGPEAFVHEVNCVLHLYHRQVHAPAQGFDIIHHPTFPTLAGYKLYHDLVQEFKDENAKAHTHRPFY